MAKVVVHPSSDPGQVSWRLWTEFRRDVVFKNGKRPRWLPVNSPDKPRPAA